MGFLGSAIANTLKEYGALESPHFEPVFDEAAGRLQVDPKIANYYASMWPLFCNPANHSGLKYAIYLDINNFLKHNAVPYLSISTENFGDERRIFSYFEIRNAYSDFLKEGVLKDLLTCSFDDLKSALAAKHASRWKPCSLEHGWGLGSILATDRVNGYLSADEKCLHFFVDGILMAKTASAAMIDAGSSLKTVLESLDRDISRAIELELQ